VRGAPVLLVSLLLLAPIVPTVGANRGDAAAVESEGDSAFSAPVVSNWSISPAPPLNLTRRQVAVVLDFNATMNTSVPANVTIGLAPGHDNTTVLGNWNNATRWTGNATIPAGGHDGANRLRARGARDPSGALMQDFLSPPFTVDTLFPASTANEISPFTNSRNITIAVSVSDATSNVAYLDLLVNPRGAGWSVFQRLTNPPWTVVYAASADGRYEFATLAGDSLLNNESAFGVETSTTVDTVVPSSSIQPIGTKVPGMEVNVTATATDANAITSVRLYYRKGAGWALYGQDNSPPYNWTFNASTLGSGVFELASGSTDIAGNIESPPAGNDTFVIFDLGEPQTELDPLPRYSGSNITLTTRVIGTGGILDTIELWVNDSSGWKMKMKDPSGKFLFPAQAEGKHEFYSILVAKSGQREAAPVGNDTWTIVDSKPPQVVASIPAPNSKGVPLDTDFTFQLTEPVDRTPGVLVFDLDGSPVLGSWSEVTPTLLVFVPVQPIQGERTHAGKLIFRDLAGNGGNYAFLFSTAPLIPPKVMLSSPKAGESVTGLTLIRVVFSVEVTADPGVETVTGPAKFDPPAWKATNMTIRVQDAKVGNYSLTLNASRVHDAQGVQLDGDGDSMPGGDFVLKFSLRPAPPPRGNLIVQVTNANGIPLPGARVILELNGTIVNDSKADQVGRAELIGLKPGLYKVTAERNGYFSQTKNVVVPAGDTAGVEFKLEPTEPPNPAFIAGAALLFALMVAMMFYGYIHSRRRDRDKAAAMVDQEPVLAARDIALVLTAEPGKAKGEVDVKWDVSNADTGYVLESSKDGKKWQDMLDVPKGIDTFTLDGLAAGSTLHLRLRCRLMGGKTVKSEVVTVKVPTSAKKAVENVKKKTEHATDKETGTVTDTGENVPKDE